MPFKIFIFSRFYSWVIILAGIITFLVIVIIVITVTDSYLTVGIS